MRSLEKKIVKITKKLENYNYSDEAKQRLRRKLQYLLSKMQEEDQILYERVED